MIIVVSLKQKVAHRRALPNTWTICGVYGTGFNPAWKILEAHRPQDVPPEYQLCKRCFKAYLKEVNDEQNEPRGS